ncbi:MAG: hypothetical protein ROW48_13165 [Bellilinea sp.]|jgi:hypothetical protein
MAAALGFALLFFVLCWLYGWAFFAFCKRWLNLSPGGESPLQVLLAGMIVLTTLAAALSLTLPLDWRSLGIILLGGAAIFFALSRQGRIRLRLPDWRAWGWLQIAAGFLLALALLTVLENSTRAVANPDTGIYHAQAIRWMEEYPAVPGLGNLHTRFAYNSHWLVLNAVFSLAFLGGRSLHLAGAMLFALAVVDFWNGVRNWTSGKRTAAHALRLMLLPLAFYVLGSQISSPGTDLPVVLFLWMLAAQWLDGRSSSGNLMIFTGAIFLVTVKLSAAPFALLAVWIALRDSHRQPGRLTGWIMLGAALLLPWLARNVVLSGYLIYPLPALDLFLVDWKIPAAIAAREAEVIRAWARLPGEEIERVLAMPLAVWAREWLSNLTFNQRGIVLAAAASPLAAAGMALFLHLKKASISLEENRLLGLYAVALAGGVYWFNSAPDLRFGFGWLLLLILLPVCWALARLTHTRLARLRLVSLALLAGLIFIQAWFLAASFEGRTFAQRWLLPVDYPHHASEPCPIENATVLCAAESSYTQCYYYPFPCIPKPVTGVEARGTDWRDGFRSVEGRD